MRLAVEQLDSARALQALPLPAGWTPIPDDGAASAPDQALAIVSRGGAIRARCALWWRRTPRLDEARVGAIGYFGATDAAAARALLRAAVDALGEAGCGIAVGPMDGSTWRRYRLVTERGTEPPFFLEPDTPAEWRRHFLAAGFAPIATYTSAVTTELGDDPHAAAAAPVLAAMGVRLRPLDVHDFADEMRRIYGITAASFRRNFLYSPIDETEFIALHAALQHHVAPSLVQIAERDGATVGFAFGVPDALEDARGAPRRTVIVKTIAVVPEFRRTGLGGVLVDRVHRRARELGYARAVHALMHDDNHSRRISRRTAVPMRRYALFGRPLAGGAKR